MTDLPLETWDQIERSSADLRHRIARDTPAVQSAAMSDTPDTPAPDTPDVEINVDNGGGDDAEAGDPGATNDD